jgi:NADH-quinone oxidoreductase subunit H
MNYADYLLKLIPVLLVFVGVLSTVPVLVILERKICAWIQERVGPNRVGLLGPDSPFDGLGFNTGTKRVVGGWLQPIADVVKLIAKEFIIPARAERGLYMLAPMLALLPPLLAFIVVPVGPDLALGTKTLMLQAADLHVGILFVLATASLSVYGIAFGGWASNNKFAQMGGVRAMAQMISYEIGMGLVILAVIMSYDSVSLRDMVYQQAGAVREMVNGQPTGVWLGGSDSIWDWGIRRQPLAFVLFVICAFAENNRLPFDLPECESELVGGYHTEYSSLGFGMFMQAEYIAILAMGALIATFFLGGWHYPGYASLAASEHWWVQALAALLGLFAFGIKMVGFALFSMWVRWTLPRFRWDQLMNVGWKGVIPLALANLLLTAALNLPAAAREKPDHRQTAQVLEK